MSLNYDEIAQKHEVSVVVVQHLANAIAIGSGQQAQFNHPELGGMGQWMPSMLMIGDAFNYQLKAKVDALCHELAAAYHAGKLETTFPTMTTTQTQWWSAPLKNPSIAGGQNTLRYAYFKDEDRLIISRNNQETVYDTSSHRITGVSQQQANHRMMLVFHTQNGQTISVEDFKIVTP